jgi:hypothetical protein
MEEMSSLIMGNNNNTNIQNNNISINMNNLREENLDMIASKDFENRVMKKLGSFSEQQVRCIRAFDRNRIKETFIMFFEEIYFNDEYPENHNIFVNSKVYNREFHVFVEEKWKKIGNLSTIKDVVLRLIDIFLEWMVDNLNSFIDTAEDQKTVDYYTEYWKILNEDIKSFKIGVNDNKIYPKTNDFKSAKTILREFFDIAYNNRKIVEKTFQDTKGMNVKQTLQLKQRIV